MKWLDRIIDRVRPERPSGERTIIFRRTRAGESVDEDLALRYAAVWACVNVIAKSIAILPWTTYQRTATGRRELPESGVSWLLHTQPNPEMGPYQFKHMLMTHVLTWGNAYCEIERDNAGRPLWLWPVTPDRVVPDRNDAGEIVYLIRNGQAGPTQIAAENMMHVRGMGFDGIVGYSPIRMAAETIGAGLAMEKFGASFFGNGANMGGVLVHPQKLSQAARENLEKSLRERAGASNALSWLVTEEGMKPERIGIPPDEAQFLETRQHTVLDICRWFGVPPHKVASLDRATWSNIEHQGIEFVTDTIQPWVTQLEEEANLKLFGRINRGRVYTKFNLGALLRGDMKSRYEAYAIGSQWGWLSANDIRSLEEMNPVKNGSMYLVPSNMMTRDQMKRGKEPAPESQQLEFGMEPEDGVAAALREQRIMNRARTR